MAYGPRNPMKISRYIFYPVACGRYSETPITSEKTLDRMLRQTWV